MGIQSLLFAMPTSPGPSFDPDFPYVSLLLNGDSFTDLSANAIGVTPQGNAAIVAGQGPFGGAAMAINVDGDYLQINPVSDYGGSVFEFGSSDFTWEFWIKTTATQYTTIYARTPSTFGEGMWELALNASGYSAGDITLYLGDYSTEYEMMQTDAVNLCDDTWHFISVSRSGSSWSIAIDGAIRVSAGFSGSIASLSDSPYDYSYAASYIGVEYIHGSDFNGFIGPLRITNGIARAITVPTAPFPTS